MTKIILPVKVLNDTLKSFSKLIKPNNIIPIMSSIYFDVENGITLKGSDSDSSLEVDMPQEYLQENTDGDFCVNYGSLSTMVAKFPETFLELKTNIKSSTLEISYSNNNGKRTRYKLPLFPSDDFTSLKNVGEVTSKMGMRSDTFCQKMKAMSSCASNDELRPAMTGIYIERTKSDLVLTSTDAHKLLNMTFPYDDVEVSVFDAIVPAKAANHLTSLSFSDDIISINVFEKHILFSDSNIRFVSRLIDHTYPSYRSVIPDQDNYSFQLIVEKGEILSCLNRLNCVTNKSSRTVICDINVDEVVLRAEDAEIGQEGVEYLSNIELSESPTNIREYPFRIGFNANHILNVLEAMDSLKVSLKFFTPTTAIVIEPLYDEGVTKKILGLSMPVMLSNGK